MCPFPAQHARSQTRYLKNPGGNSHIDQPDNCQLGKSLQPIESTSSKDDALLIRVTPIQPLDYSRSDRNQYLDSSIISGLCACSIIEFLVPWVMSFSEVQFGVLEEIFKFGTVQVLLHLGII